MPRRFIPHSPMGGYGSLNIVPSHVVLMAQCMSCGAMRELERNALEEKAGPHGDFTAIEKRLRCECGAREGKIVTGYYASE